MKKYTLKYTGYGQGGMYIPILGHMTRVWIDKKNPIALNPEKDALTENAFNYYKQFEEFGIKLFSEGTDDEPIKDEKPEEVEEIIPETVEVLEIVEPKEEIKIDDTKDTDIEFKDHIDVTGKDVEAKNPIEETKTEEITDEDLKQFLTESINIRNLKKFAKSHELDFDSKINHEDLANLCIEKIRKQSVDYLLLSNL
jgi:hypothetical protein